MDNPKANSEQGFFFENQNETKQDNETPKKQKVDKSGDVLSKLLSIGQITDTFDCFSAKWEIKLLSQDELLSAHRQTIQKGLSENLSSRMSNNIVETLAMAIVSVDGKPISMWLQKAVDRKDYDTDEGYKFGVREKFREYLGSLAPDILDELFDKYTELNNRRVKEINELKKK